MYFRWALAASLALPLAFAEGALPGVGNFHQVSPTVYRSAQPTAEGFQSIAKAGVKTVIDLCGGEAHVRWEEKAVQAAGMRHISVPLGGHSAPTDAQISKLIGLLNDPSLGPVLVHCRRGADRTGTVIAVYRITHDGWSNDAALKEARMHGMSFLEWGMQGYVTRYRSEPVTAVTAVGTK